MHSPSPVEPFSFFGHSLWLKRDDLLPEPFSGNKGRKFASLLTDRFDGVQTLIGYGSPQSNSLYSLAALASRRGWQLEFYVDHIAASIYADEEGNYGGALALGAKVMRVPDPGMLPREYIESIRLKQMDANACLYVPEGGRCALARTGVHTLGREIADWAAARGMADLKVFLPSGTGTTALYLSEYFHQQHSDIRVVTCPVVGDGNYLIAQFAELSADSHIYPEVVGGAHHYAKLKRDELEIWLAMRRQGLEFELLYDPCGLLVLRSLLDANAEGNWLYLHQGGLRGNVSMLPRYRRKFAQFFEKDSA
ncbi:pyridoxal-phosphate dependent enzyme [Shewanella litorisediminis]|uniref:Pyridoxal-phosphate dependent enzyme n=1 Tax=Shewanella litorisediminis TaxID=1173586 RepID=A0ABX7G7E4_9GAMM|nr:pyridoxal-phosphate dependent enzyme [Shewanella litorisediminis]MCL2919774.1 pyridoxal-phosphate dependent enzyme [Shewanella litorisediminis]QRH03284.1 pyridoxal-phosphate dependent enzyme [Shewanella litorisediminis]